MEVDPFRINLKSCHCGNSQRVLHNCLIHAMRLWVNPRHQTPQEQPIRKAESPLQNEIHKVLLIIRSQKLSGDKLFSTWYQNIKRRHLNDRNHYLATKPGVLLKTIVTTNSHKIIKIPHHFETGRLFIKDVLPTSLIRRYIHFCESVSNWVFIDISLSDCGATDHYLNRCLARFPYHWIPLTKGQ